MKAEGNKPKRPALSMEEMLKKYPWARDGNKKMKEHGITSLIIPARERLSKEEFKERMELFKKK
jgi:hypothetical protein